MEEKKNSLEDRIVLLVRDKLKHYGYKGVLTNDIAEELGISKRTLYQHISSKDEMIEIVLRREFQTIVNALEKKTEVLKTELKVECKDGFTMLKTDSILNAIFSISQFLDFDLVADLKKNMFDTFDRLDKEFHNKVFTALENLFNASKEAGFIKSHIDSKMVFYLMHTAIHTMVNEKRHLELGVSSNEMIANIMNLMFFGMSTEKANTELSKVKFNFEN